TGSSDSHDWPHAPQFFGSVWVLTQAPPQQVGDPAGHCVPHFPQFLGSVCRFTQLLLQSVSWAFVQTQAPPWQLWPLPQARPQLPQLFGLFWTLTQPPLQGISPAGQTQLP